MFPVEADKCGGVPCSRGLRVPVATVVNTVAEGMTTDAILEAYPYLEADDIREALNFVADAWPSGLILHIIALFSFMPI